MSHISKQPNVLAELRSQFQAQSFVFNRGLERETLRVDQKAHLAKTTHPDFLGSKLTHPTVTTDFSEAQLELITPVSQSIDETLKTLDDTHRYIYSQLQDELLWSSSMPCVLQEDSAIPLAQYGTSNLAELKTTYRNGLGVRYGRSMQTICAVHYNFSFSDALWQDLARLEGVTNTKNYRNERYFDVMRNFRRFSWLAIYLTGASPTVDQSFVKQQKHKLHQLDIDSLYLEQATSLRNGNLGYQSDAQSELIDICYNTLENYVHTLANAINSPYESYTDISNNNKAYVQLNDSILQSEAEFYTTIRAKRVPPPGTNFLKALLADGVEYIEVRLLDVNPFQPLGIDATTMRFIDTLLLHCLLIPSPKHDDTLCRSVKTNVGQVVDFGRDTSTQLDDRGSQRSILNWGTEILDDLLLLAQQLDGLKGGNEHQAAIKLQQEKLANAKLTPSGKILDRMQEQSISFTQFAMNQALEHQQYFLSKTLSEQEKVSFNEIATKSFRDQRIIENSDSTDFTSYLAALHKSYLAL